MLTGEVWSGQRHRAGCAVEDWKRAGAVMTGCHVTVHRSWNQAGVAAREWLTGLEQDEQDQLRESYREVESTAELEHRLAPI